MRLTLVESDRHFFQTAECAFASFLAHTGLIILAMGLTQGGRQMPADEREAKAFFLLPPDRVEARTRQTDFFRWGKPGMDLEDGIHKVGSGEGLREPTQGVSKWGARSGARGLAPFGPVKFLVPDSVFSMLQVDRVVERYEGSAAPVYPSELMAKGTPGTVRAFYVVDTTGHVDTTTINVVTSDDPRFTASVVTALGLMRFRPATRGGKAVRQLVAQQFRFLVMPPDQASREMS